MKVVQTFAEVFWCHCEPHLEDLIAGISMQNWVLQLCLVGDLLLASVPS